MTRIVFAREIDPPPKRDWERQVFPAPDGSVSLVFDQPGEYRMGAYAWDARLEGRVDVDFKPLLRGRGRFFGAWPPDCYAPWSHDSRRVVLFAVGADPYETVVYDVETRDLQALDTSELPIGAAWAPDRNVLLVLYEDVAELRRPSAVRHAFVRLEVAENEQPLAGWLATGDHFFTVTRPAYHEAPRVEFFASADARSLGGVELAPSVVLSEARSGSGRHVHLQHYADDDPRFLDRWEEVRFDRTAQMILLAAHQPVGSAYRYFGELMRQLEERWVAVEIEL
ncbi:MAG TPA: hypothetical protein VGW30_05500 [Gaiellaceae bacterium]|nr:hypothetical protein [Gaiellaceae bacterium]